MNKKVLVLTGVIFAILGLGCSTGGHKFDGNLALGGYRSLEIEEVEVATATPCDPDKLASRVKDSLKTSLTQGTTWSNASEPTARIKVRIVGFHQRSDAARVFIGLPDKVEFVVRGCDAKSQQPLGEATGASKIGLGSGFLTGGLAGVTMNQMVERALPAGFREDSMVYIVANDVMKALGRARGRYPPTVPADTSEPKETRLVAAQP